MTRFATILVLIGALLLPTHGFLHPTYRTAVRRPPNGWRSVLNNRDSSPSRCSKTVTARFMYNLPPGGGGGNRNELSQILGGILTAVGLVAFFASPLGGLFFALFNSLFALAILLPIFAVVAFQVWQFFNTVQGACPSCSAPLRLLKDGSPSICLNCGAIVQATEGGDIVTSPGSSSVFQEEEEESFFGGILDDAWGVSRQPDKQQDQYRRERTIIDVEIEDDDRKK